MGIGVIVAVFSSVVRAGSFYPSYLIPIFLFGLLPIGFGTLALVLGIRDIYHWAKLNQTKKSAVETTAKIIDYKVVSHGKSSNINKRYALKLAYKFNDENKTFTTDYLYDINEFRYLKSLAEIKIKVGNNFVAVAEPFTKEIYKLDSKYGIELAFYKQKPVATCLRVWRVLCIIAIVFLFVSIVLTTVLKNGIYLIIGVSFLLAVNIPTAIIIAVFLIKWFKRKRK